MRILLLSSAYNGLTQRVHVELADRGHEVSVELALGDEVMRERVSRCDPDLVIAPMLTTAIPADVWSARPCLIVHPVHLNVIEAAGDPAAESWRNINAINDLVEAILTTTDRLTVAALAGNAAAGGLMLALAADEVWCRAGAVLNPHYRLMGLHGSEYWTYTLPRRVGAQRAARLTAACLPVSPSSALQCGMVDRVIEGRPASYREQVAALAEELAHSPGYQPRLAAKERQLATAATVQPLHAYRQAELAIISRNFFDPREPYRQLRRAFVYKQKPTRTPPHLAGPAAASYCGRESRRNSVSAR